MCKNAKVMIESPYAKNIRKAAAEEITKLNVCIAAQMIVNILLAVAVIIK